MMMEGIFYFFNSVEEESSENARDSVKTKAAWR